MISDIASLVIDDSCLQCSNCQHDNSVLTFNDGRTVRWLSARQIYPIISKLADEKINPQGGWSPQEVRKHFENYPQCCIDLGNELETVDDILYELFANATTQ